jgi:FkbM family methyltransferase
MKIKRLLSAIKNRVYTSSRPSLDDLDRKLEKYLNFRNGFFIEAGANDGYSQSNTYFLEKKRNWKGVLIEGIPELCAKCKKRRTKSIVKNCALVSSDFSRSTVKMHYANLMSVVDGALKTEEDQNKHINAGITVQQLDGSYSITVPARTLESILDDIPELPYIDFLSLDVEGYELNVL